jgi:hypothetical protein
MDFHEGCRAIVPVTRVDLCRPALAAVMEPVAARRAGLVLEVAGERELIPAGHFG